MAQYRYFLAGLNIQLTAPFSLTITPESAPFLETAEQWGEADHRIVLSPCAKLPPCPEGSVTVGENTYVRRPNGMGLVYHRLFPGEEPVVLVADEQGSTVLYFLPKGESWVKETFGLMNLLELDDLLLRHDRLMLHASFITWQGRGILFSAPSGAGKSTQAALWEEHQAAHIINGDRAALSREDGQWYAHGLPFAGSSLIFRRESAPVCLLICLSQGKENRAVRLTPLEALRRLLPEINLRRWDGHSTEKATGLLTELVTQVPVYHLTCRPDKDATETVKALMDQV